MFPFSRRRSKKAGRGRRTTAHRRPSKKPRFESLEDRWLMSAADIIAENLLPGAHYSEWDINGTPSANIQGYAVGYSVNHGETVDFKVSTNSTDYRLDIYRMGWYGGLGARKVATIQPSNLQAQPQYLIDVSRNMVDASNWHVSASWDIPDDAVSGVYIAKLIREDGVFGENHIIFVVRDDEGHSDMLFQTSDTTWQAYNTWGGSSLYAPNYPNGRALAVSYNRPFANYSATPLNYFFGEEYAMVRFLERNGYDVSYFSGIDSARYGSELLEHQIFLSVGHDEYWSGDQRANVEAARDAGVDLTFFSGNEVFWKHRWEADRNGNDFTVLVCYKETLANAKIDPIQDTWTGTWRDPRFASTTDGGIPENALTGTMFSVNSNGKLGTTIDVAGEYAGLRFWRNTIVETLGASQSVTLGDRVLGYEWDDDFDNGFRPAGLIPLSYTTRNVAEYLQDYGSYYAKGTSNHSMTLYRADSGALVFSAGTVQYSWALDDFHAVFAAATDRNLQQATINLFADMGVAPSSLMSGLVYTAASTDFLAPISVITSPAVGAVFASGSQVTIRGTAQEQGGGAVAVVEVSVDGGKTWHRATGRENWTYTFTTRGSGQFTIMSRAVDDSGNIEVGGPQVIVNPVQNPGVYSLWNNADVPGTVDALEGDAVELGVRFTADVDGVVTGIRFYKSAANTGTHVGHLWSSTGQLLATATFTSESASGWQQATFSTPVTITAGSTYIASYFAPNGHFAVDRNYFTTQGVNSGPLHAIPQGPAGGNGVFRYGSTSGFPTQSYLNSNYWVDVVFNTNATNDDIAPTVESFSTLDGSSTLTTDSQIVVKFSEAINVASLSASTVQLLNPDPNTIPGGCCSTPGGWCSGCPLNAGADTKVISATLNYDVANHSVILTPLAPLDTSAIYTVLVTGGQNGVKDMAGNALATDTAASFLTPGQAASVQSTIWSDATQPAKVDGGDGNSIEVGVKFTADTSGYITGLRFYKSAANTGTHVGHLWSSTGALLATATFTNESATGWQQVNFATPVAITAGTTYTASYFAPTGHYSADTSYFNSQYNSGPLHVTSSGGVYRYGSTGAFPSQTYLNTNYWVDVVLRSAPLIDTSVPLVTAISPSSGTTNVSVTSTARVTFSEPIDPTSITTATVKLIDGGNNLVPSTLSYEASTRTVTITPTSPMAFGTTYTVVVMGGLFGVKDLAGNSLAENVGSTFTTVAAPAPDTTPPTVISTTPANGAVNIAPTSVFSVTFSEALNAATVDANKILLLKNATNRVTAGVTYNAATRTVTITPAEPLENATNYTIYVPAGTSGVRDLAGNAMVSDFVSSFTTSSAVLTSTLWSNSVTPSVIDVRESDALELGVKFTANSDGYITGVRFYKSSGNVGTHTGHLWTSSGQMLASATFTNETSSGWQQVNFSTPVAVTAGTTYVASYFAPNGNFSVDRNFFDSSLTNGSMTVTAGGGVFRYGTTGAFPSQSYQNSNYWVDVVLSTTPPADTTPPTVSSTSPAGGATGVSVNSPVTVFFSEAMDAATISNSNVKLLDGNSIVTANVTHNSGNNSVTITPTVALANSRTYSVTVVGGFQGVMDAAGNPLAQSFLSTFTTAAPAPADTTPPTVTGTNPAGGATNVATSTSVTVTFSETLNAATVNGTTVRLLSGGTQVTASVSYNASTRTATITPTSALNSSTTYTISVLGGSSGIKDAAGNALAQTTTSTFTTSAPAPADTTPPTVTGTTPAGGATNVATSTSVTVTFSETLNAATVNGTTVRLLSGGTPVTAGVSYNASTRTATITPTSALSESTTYTISILGGASGVKDSAGNALAQTATSSFTTVAPAPTPDPQPEPPRRGKRR